MQCPACNHNGSTKDFGRPPRCPECGAFYEKALVARAKRNELAASLEARRLAAEKPATPIAPLKWLGKAKAIIAKDAGRNIVFAAGISFVSLVGIALWMKPPPKETARLQPQAPPFAAPISPGALTKYDREQYPKTYSNWGDLGVARIAETERRAAELVSKSGYCDRVDMVGLSNMYSRVPDRIVVYVDCANRKRAYVGDSELSGAHKLVFKSI